STPLKLTLNPIALGMYTKGAYLISYNVTGDLPKTGVQIFLCVGGDQRTLEITDCPRHDVMDEDNLPDLLGIFQTLKQWGTSLDCTIQVKTGAQVLAKSNSQPLACPVKPYSGSLNFDGISREIPALTYPGNGY